METVFFIAAKLVAVILSIVSTGLFVRAILSFSEELSQSSINYYAYLITEPFVAPVRMILYKYNIGVDSMFDIPFITTCVIIMVLRMFLPVI